MSHHPSTARRHVARKVADAVQHDALVLGFPARAAKQTARLAAELVRSGTPRAQAITRARRARSTVPDWDGPEAA